LRYASLARTCSESEGREGAVNMTMVRVDGVNKQYGTVLALESIDLSIEKGEFVTLLGPSGAGKTTLLNLIAGLLEPSRGRIWIDGVDATDFPPNRRGLGMVFQNYALMPHMTIFENIAFPLRVRKMPKSEIQRRVKEVLDLVQLPDISRRKPKELSGGQQQRIALARALVYNPAMILMDEPLGALDKKLREQMQLELKRLHTELRVTVLYVTHDQQEALTMSDRIVLMNVGRVEQIGTPNDLYFNPRSVFAADFLGDSNLVDGRIDAFGDNVLVSTCSGLKLNARRCSFGRVGEPIKIMVRPENVAVIRDREDAALVNRAEGVAVDSIILGGVVKHYVRLDDGTIITAQELTRTGQTTLTPGARICLGWRAEDTLFLPMDGVMPPVKLIAIAGMVT
jgi:putative spermidine/putrescine transport system ATP-binding protein